MRRLLIVLAAVVAAACVWLAISMRGDGAPAPASTAGAGTAAGSSATAPVAPPASTLASPTSAPTLAAGAAADPAAADRDVIDDPPPDPPAGGVARAQRPEKKPLTPEEQRAMQARGVALLDLQIASLQKEIDAAAAAHDDARAAQLRVRLARMEDTRRIRQAALDAPATPGMH